MSRPFLPSEINQIRRIAEAIVPHNCSVQAVSINQGWKVTLVICGLKSCHTYNLDPPLNREAIVRIASAWETGNYEFVATAPRPAEKTFWVRNSGELVAWARSAKPGQKAAYFDGSIAHFRNDANKQLRELQAQADRRTGKTKSAARDSAIIDRLQQQLELLNTIERLRQGEVIDLVQQRKPDGSGAIYFAVRK